MANENERNKQEQRVQREISEEEQKRLNMHLRGGRNLDEQEDERGVLGASPEQSGSYRHEMARDYGTRREQNSDMAKPEGRRGGRTEH